jgi:hypothetical protein
MTNEEQDIGGAAVDRETEEIVETPLDAFRRSAGFQFMFVLHSGLEVGRAIDHLCASAEKFSAAMREWQPIETAPKDGTRLLLWCVHHNAQYADDPVEFSRWAGAVIGSWTNHNGGGWTWSGHAGTPIHWMPLPEPPKPDTNSANSTDPAHGQAYETKD